MEEFDKTAKKAAHKYAMLAVVSPFIHKEAVKDIEDLFLAGVYAERENCKKEVETQKRGLSISELLDQTFYKHVSEYYHGAENNKELMLCIKNDIYKGFEWSINYSLKEMYE